MEPRTIKQDLLRKLPSVDSLLTAEAVNEWLTHHPRMLVVDCLRDALEMLRKQILDDTAG